MQELLVLHKKYEENAKWIGDRYEQLKRKYDGEWVAVLDKKIIAHDRSFRRLIRSLETRYKDVCDEIAVEYVTKKPLNIIL